MQASDSEEFAILLTGALAFYRQEVTEFTLGVWWEACKPYSVEQVRKALTAHAMDAERGRFPPMPADMVRVLQGTQQDRSLVAWGRVLDAAQRIGAYSSVDFGEPEIHCAIEDVGGWSAFCRAPTEQLSFMQKRFCDAHRAYTNRGEALRDVPYLVGVSESENRGLGRPVAAPVALGLERTQARLRAEAQRKPSPPPPQILAMVRRKA